MESSQKTIEQAKAIAYGLKGGILKASPNYLEVCFIEAMPFTFYHSFKSSWRFYGNLEKINPDHKKYVMKYLWTYYKQGYFEPMELPYEYNLETKTLTVKNCPQILKDYGFYPAEIIENHDIPF